MSSNISVVAADSCNRDELRDLYASVGWGAYTRDIAGLHTAVANSSYVVTARDDGALVGLARCLSDDTSICYLQDILVRPEYQHQGNGTRLVAACLARYKHVRSKVLLTDDEDAQHSFYRSMGFVDTRDVETANLHTFVRMRGITPQDT